MRFRPSEPVRRNPVVHLSADGNDHEGPSSLRHRGCRAIDVLITFLLLFAGAFGVFLVDRTVKLRETIKWDGDGARGVEPNWNIDGPNGKKTLVTHAFAYSKDRKFVATDRYFVNIDGEIKIAVVGDGNIPLEFYNGPKIVKAKFECKMGENTARAHIVNMRGHKGNMKEHYDNKKKYPFSTNGDNFKTMIIYCELPAEPSKQRHQPLILQGKGFELEISTPFVRTDKAVALNHMHIPKVGRIRPAEEYSSVMCLCPMYGIKGSRWLAEYIEYHKAAGISHIHVYSYDDPNTGALRSVLDEYQGSQAFMTLHDWTHKTSQGFTQGHTYEHAKWSAMTDCLLRTRGVADFVLFNDIDEVVFSNSAGRNGKSSGLIGPALRECHRQHIKSSSTKLGCSYNSHTITSVFTKLSPAELEEEKASNGLLLERYSWEEKKPLCPYNCRNGCNPPTGKKCRKFHYGRQKYMMYTGDVSIPPLVPWTHAPWRDYDLADSGVYILPDELIHVRHYQGHWYQNGNMLNTVKETPSPLPKPLMDQVRTKLSESVGLKRALELYPGKNGVDWIEPQIRDPVYHHRIGDAEKERGKGMDRYTCTAKEAQTQEKRIEKRFKEWWSHSACPDQVWMDSFAELMRLPEVSPDENTPIQVLDIGCNKGYTSSDFMDILSPVSGFNAKTNHRALNDVARDMKTKFNRSCGACGDCLKKPGNDRERSERVDIHCFEPSPATFDVLNRMNAKLTPEVKSGGKAKWHIYNKGLHKTSGILAWHQACNTVGDELCKIVSEDTPNSIKVEVTTVDEFVSSHIPKGPIHMLKVDAEGLDPDVLKGATKVLTEKRAIMVMFEYNPGLRQKKPPYGMWGTSPGLTKLLDVTQWLDKLSYDCYLDSRVDGPKGINAPPLYRITGDCIRRDPHVPGWSNVICASRKYSKVAERLMELAKLVNG